MLYQGIRLTDCVWPIVISNELENLTKSSEDIGCALEGEIVHKAHCERKKMVAEVGRIQTVTDKGGNNGRISQPKMVRQIAPSPRYHERRSDSLDRNLTESIKGCQVVASNAARS